MKKKFLVVVDMQNDFVTGSLGTDEAKAIKEKVVEKVLSFDGEVVFTKDTHAKNYLETQEGKILPVKHCIKGTDGWNLIDELESFATKKGSKIIEKPSFGSGELANFIGDKFNDGKVESVELIGLCTDVCVVSNAILIKTAAPELEVSVDSSLCAGISPKKHDAALETMRSCQVIVK